MLIALCNYIYIYEAQLFTIALAWSDKSCHTFWNSTKIPFKGTKISIQRINLSWFSYQFHKCNFTKFKVSPRIMPLSFTITLKAQQGYNKDIMIKSRQLPLLLSSNHRIQRLFLYACSECVSNWHLWTHIKCPSFPWMKIEYSAKCN